MQYLVQPLAPHSHISPTLPYGTNRTFALTAAKSCLSISAVERDWYNPSNRAPWMKSLVMPADLQPGSVLVAGRWQTGAAVAGMTPDVQRNAMVVEVTNHSNLTVAAAGARGNDQLVQALVGALVLRDLGLRTVAQLKALSDSDQRNTLVLEVVNLSNLTVTSAGARSNDQLAQALVGAFALRDLGIRTANQLKTLSDGDQRNTLVVEASLRNPAYTVPRLQALSNLRLAQLCASAVRVTPSVLPTAVPSDLRLAAVLVAGRWRNAKEVAAMPDGDMRNTIVVELNNMTNLTIAALQAMSDDARARVAIGAIVLRDLGIRSVADLRAMSDGDQRNALIVEVANATSLPVSAVASRPNEDLARILVGAFALRGLGIRTADQLKTLSDGDQRNILVVEASLRNPAYTVPQLQALPNQRLAQLRSREVGLAEWKETNGQQWRVTSLGDGTFKIVNVEMGAVLAVDEAVYEVRPRVALRAWTGADSQKWRLTEVWNGHFRIDALQGGLTLTVEATSDSLCVAPWRGERGVVGPGGELLNADQDQLWILSDVRSVSVLSDPSVRFYTGENYAGTATEKGVGKYVHGVGPVDAIPVVRSIRIPLGMRVTFFPLRGWRARFKSELVVRCQDDAGLLGTERYASVLVEKVAIAYPGINFEGPFDARGVGRARSLKYFNNGLISGTRSAGVIGSLRVPRGLMVTLWKGEGWTGEFRTYFEDVADLGDFKNAGSMAVKYVGVAMSEGSLAFGDFVQLSSSTQTSAVWVDSADNPRWAPPPAPDDPSQFQLVRAGGTTDDHVVSFGDVVAMKTKQNRYLSVSGALVATRAELTPTETWRIVRSGATTHSTFMHGMDTVSFQSLANGGYLKRTGGGVQVVSADGPPEEAKFVVIDKSPAGPDAGGGYIVKAPLAGSGACSQDFFGFEMQSACGVDGCGSDSCAADACGAATCQVAASMIAVCGAAAGRFEFCGADVAGAGACGMAACGAAAAGIAACGADVCGAAACAMAACGAAACGADACGTAFDSAGICSAALCGVAFAGAESHLFEVCLANACALDACPVDACSADACALDIIPIIPGI